jgi:hypothetical protein
MCHLQYGPPQNIYLYSKKIMGKGELKHCHIDNYYAELRR